MVSTLVIDAAVFRLGRKMKKEPVCIQGICRYTHPILALACTDRLDVSFGMITWQISCASLEMICGRNVNISKNFEAMQGSGLQDFF